MSEVLTENQKILIRYLAAIGCSKAVVFRIIGDLWYDPAVREMLQFCKENHPPSQEELLKQYSIVYSKYKREIDSIPEWGDEETEE